MSTTPPLPQLHKSGALYASEKECKWWLSTDVVKEDFRKIDHATPGPEGTQGRLVNGHNKKWVKAAQNFLTDYVVSTDASGGPQQFARSLDGIISAALTRIRDDKVVQSSISGIDDRTLKGLTLSHRDVLAAVALLSRLDRTSEDDEFQFDAQSF